MNIEHLEKIAGLWQDFVVNPLRQVGEWIKEDYNSLVDDQAKWYRENIWDNTPGGFSKLQKWLAGSTYTDMIKGAPTRVYRPDGSYYYKQRTPQGILDHASKKFSWNDTNSQSGLPLWQHRMQQEINKTRAEHQRQARQRFEITGNYDDSPVSNKSYAELNRKLKVIRARYRSKGLRDRGL